MPVFKLSVRAHKCSVWDASVWNGEGYSLLPIPQPTACRVVLAGPDACKYLGLPHRPVSMGRKQPDNFMIHKSKQQTCSEIH